MNFVEIKVPEDYAKRILVGELNSYAYNEDNQVLVYLKEFKYGRGEQIEAGVEMYPMPKENPLAAHFTVKNSTIPGFRMLNVDAMAICDMNGVMIRLMQFCASTTCLKTNAPLFDQSQVPVQEETNWDAEQSYPYGPGMKPEPGDIIIPIPNEPLNFEDPSKFDKE